MEGLNVGDTIHISSISLPDGCVPTITDRDFTVATIASPRGGMSEEEEQTTEEEVKSEGEQQKVKRRR